MRWRDTATAHHAWQERWATDAGRAAWSDPEAEVMAVVAGLGQPAGMRALDLGCGVGRHALYLAAQGLTVSGLDASPRGVVFVRDEAAKRGLRLGLVVGVMTDLPYGDHQFDYVVGWNVIYHGDGEVVRRCIAEIHRVLRPDGLYQGTMLSKRSRRYGQGRQVAPNTFVQDDGEGDKAHPHFYCDGQEATELFSAFELRSLVDRAHRKPDTYHWRLVARRRG
jgi:tellurite methyltransferase